MITSSELAWMQSTENQAMSSTAVILSPSYTNGALGETLESWLIAGTVNCDIWPIARNDREKSSGNQELSKGEFYISFPYNTALHVENKVVVDTVLYDLTFVPTAQSWLTNQRCEARNYNASPITVTLGTAIYQYGMDQLIEVLTNIKSVLMTTTVSKSAVSSGTVSQQFLAENSSRTGLQLYNNGTATLYVKLGGSASTTDFTERPIEANAYWEMPFPVYRGSIHGVWDSANGTAVITEFS